MKNEELTGALHTVRGALNDLCEDYARFIDEESRNILASGEDALALIDKILAEYADIKKDYVSGYHDHNYMINSCMADFLATITQEPTK